MSSHIFPVLLSKTTEVLNTSYLVLIEIENGRLRIMDRKLQIKRDASLSDVRIITNSYWGSSLLIENERYEMVVVPMDPSQRLSKEQTQYLASKESQASLGPSVSGHFSSLFIGHGIQGVGASAGNAGASAVGAAMSIGSAAMAASLLQKEGRRFIDYLHTVAQTEPLIIEAGSSAHGATKHWKILVFSLAVSFLVVATAMGGALFALAKWNIPESVVMIIIFATVIIGLGLARWYVERKSLERVE